MEPSFFNKPEKIEMNCPYCWAEFSDFQQINGRIRYQNKMYDDFFISPIENAELFPYPITSQSFKQKLEIKPIQCNSCHREYALILAPFERGNYDKKRVISNEIQKKNDCDGKPSILEKIVPFDIQDSSVKKGLSNLKFFFLINFFPIIAMLFLILVQNFSTSIKILLMLLTEIVLIYCSAWFAQKIQFFFNIENIPILCHKKFLKSKSFHIFNQYFFNYDVTRCENSKSVSKFAFFCTIILMVFGIWSTWGTLSNQHIVIILVTIFTSALFFWFLILILASMFSQLETSFEFLLFISLKIPLRLDPWEKKQEISIYKNLWAWTLILFLFSTVGLEIILNIFPINDILKEALSTNDFSSIMTPLLNDPFGMIFVIMISIILFLFITFFYAFDNNIKRRKSELRHIIRDRIHETDAKADISNADVVNTTILLNELKMIDDIPLLFIKWSSVVIVIEILQIATFLFHPF
jgi:hypothetical protein